MSAWIKHVKEFQKDKKCSYKEAMQHPECKKSYHSKKGGALGFKKLGSKLDNFGDDVASRSKKVYKKSINDLNEAKEYLGDTENRHYGRKINNYVQKSNQYVQAAKPVINMVPGGKYLTAGSQAQANLSNQIYKDSRKPASGIDGAGFDPYHFQRTARTMIPNYELQDKSKVGRGFLTNGEMRKGGGFLTNGEMRKPY